MRGFCRQAAQVNFIAGDFIEQGLAEFRIEFTQRHLHVFCNGQCRKQCTTLKQHTPTSPHVGRLVLLLADHAFVKNSDLT